jgi:hypothetical protein
VLDHVLGLQIHLQLQGVPAKSARQPLHLLVQEQSSELTVDLYKFFSCKLSLLLQLEFVLLRQANQVFARFEACSAVRVGHIVYVGLYVVRL